MSVLASLVLVALTTQQVTKPPKALLGDWVTIQAPGVEGKETLHLDKNGTFTLVFKAPKQPDHKAQGKYEVKAELPPGSKDPNDVSVYLEPVVLDGTEVDKVAPTPKKLGFYSKGPILTDVIAVIFCHHGDEEKIKKMFESKPGK